jgi:hypothetical protein
VIGLWFTHNLNSNNLDDALQLLGHLCRDVHQVGKEFASHSRGLCVLDASNVSFAALILQHTGWSKDFRALHVTLPFTLLEEYQMKIYWSRVLRNNYHLTVLA